MARQRQRGSKPGARAQDFAPIDASTPEVDTNSLLASASYSGGVLAATLQSPGAHPLPGDGVIWDCGPVRNWWGEAGNIETATPPDVWVHLAGALPSDTWVACILADGPPDTATYAYGAMVRAGGVLAGCALASGTWAVGTGGTDASLRLARTEPGTQNVTTNTRYLGGVGYDADGVPVTGMVITTLTTILQPTAWTRVWLAAGWVAGSGGPTAEVSFHGHVIGAAVGDLIARAGL